MRSLIGLISHVGRIGLIRRIRRISLMPRRQRFLLLVATAVVLFPLFYLTLKYGRSVSATWSDDNYSYRKKITITNNGSAQTDHTVQVVVDTATLITAGKMQSDCDDVRFTNINGKLLNYFTEVGCNSAKTVFFVTSDTIQATSSIIYIYYGNPSASSASKFTELPEGVDYGNGGDSAVTISSSTNINTANSISGRSCADGGDAVNYSVTASVEAAATNVTLSSTPSTGCLVVGDEVLIINLQGTSSNNANVGKYETARITAISTATLTLNHPLINAYDGTTQKIMVQRVPNYTNVTVNSGINFTATAWNGTKGGVMAFRSDGIVTVTGNISISSNGYNGGALNANTQGESYGGTGTTSTSANLGGGGTFTCNPGGGGYGSSGNNGINQGCGGPGLGGSTYGQAALSSLFLGSGGGSPVNTSAGGRGGGTIYIGASTISVSGTVISNGGNGGSSCNRNGGGGSGGSILLQAVTTTLGSSLVTSTGGTGGNSCSNTGGNGGSGRIALYYSTVSGTTNPSADTSTVPVVASFASEEKGQQPAAYWKFDEGQGSTAQDSTVNNNDGTLGASTAAPTWTEESRCVSGKCLQFDGSNDYVDSGTGAGYLNQTSSFAVSSWFRTTSTSAVAIIDRNGSTTTNYRLFVNARSGVGTANKLTARVFFASSGAINLTTTQSVNDGKWHYTSFVYDAASNNLYLYLDGMLVVGPTAGGTGTLSTLADKTFIGVIGSNAVVVDSYWNGFLDEVKIYPYARSAAQVKADFVKGSSAKGGGVLGAADTSALSQGLVGYWKMDESATPSLDSSGNSNSGTWNGNVAATTGKFGNGTTFDGTGDYVSITDSTSLQPTGNFSMSAWVYPTSCTDTERIISKWDGSSNGTDNGGFVFDTGDGGAIDGCGIRMAFYDSNDTIHITGTSGDVLTVNTWNFVTATLKDGTLTTYVNGVKQTTGSLGETSVTDSAFTWGIGHDVDQGSNDAEQFTGRIDEARIYNRALSPAEVSQLYNFAPGPYAYYSFDEGSGSQVSDKSGNGFSASWSGSSTHWSEGRFGSAAKFSGTTTDYVRTAALTKPNMPITFSFWVKPTTTSISGLYDTSPGSMDVLRLYDNEGGIQWWGAPTRSVSLTAGQWSHIAAIYKHDGTNRIISWYKNGVFQSTTSLAGSSNFAWTPSTFTLGNINGSLAPYSGLLDEFKIYNYERTQKQIVEDMNAGHPVGGSPVGSTVATFHMDDMEGTVAEDSSINNNDLTLSSRSWTQSGKVNGAWNGTNAVWLSRADDADFDVSATEDYAITGWVKSDSASNPGAVEYVVNKASSVIAGYAVYFNTSGNLCFGIDDDTTWNPDIASCTTTDVYDNSWHHFSAVRDTVADKTYIYVDAVLKDSDSDTTSATLANSLLLYVGDRDGTDNGDEFAGDIDEINIYRSALNAEDVKIVRNYNSSVAVSVLGATEASTLSDGAGNAPVAEWLMNEGVDNTCTGGTNDVCDTSGNGNDGASSGGPTWTAGKYGAGLRFDGSDDYVNVSSSSSLSFGTENFSVNMWVYPTSFSAEAGLYDSLALGGLGTRANAFILVTNVTTGKLRLFTNSAYTSSTNGSLTLNAWNHISIVRSGTAVTFYINGVADSVTVTLSTNITSGAAIIGRYADVSAGYFTGSIDEARVYNYARTASQVAYDYNRGRPVAHWRLDECQGSTAYGSPLGANYDSTLNGTITIGASGTQTSVGTCGSGTASEAWNGGTTGKFNSSLNFDGTDDYVDIADTSSVDFGTGNFALSAWVKLTATISNEFILSKDSNSQGRQFSLAIDDANDSNDRIGIAYFTTNDSTVVYLLSDSNPITDTNWHHVLGQKNGNSFEIYLDGKLIKSGTTGGIHASMQATSAPIRIGNRAYAGFEDHTNGQIDDVQIFNYALSPAQVKKVMNEGAVRYGPATGAP